MTVRRLASICVLIFANLLIGVFYFQSRRPLLFASELENETLLWNSSGYQQRLVSIADARDTDNKSESLPHPYKYVINSQDLCSRGSNRSEKLSLLILVCSAVANINVRMAIRESWGSIAAGKNNTGAIRLGFLLGSTNNLTLQKSVERESRLYSDVIQESFFDAYRNLTLKSIMLLKWTSENCPNVHFVLKTDDDVYVNVPKLVSTLTKLPVKSKVMYGTLFRKAKPNRNPSDKWYVPKEQFRGDVFPDYLSGTGYVISRDIVPALYKVSATMPFLVMEDVFITGLCASEAGARRYNVKGFAHWRRSPTGCAFKDAVTGHHVTMRDMRKIWSELQNTKLKCPPPKKGS